MILYHGTSLCRANLILESGVIRKDVQRYFTKENNGSNYSSDGFIYLSNEIMWAYRFAMLHGHLVDKETYGYIFRLIIPDERILPDEDELRDMFPHVIQKYSNRLEASLLERKSCRVNFNIDLHKYNGEYCRVPVGDEMSELLQNNGRDYKYTVTHYTRRQKEFINRLEWIKFSADTVERVTD